MTASVLAVCNATDTLPILFQSSLISLYYNHFKSWNLNSSKIKKKRANFKSNTNWRALVISPNNNNNNSLTKFFNCFVTKLSASSFLLAHLFHFFFYYGGSFPAVILYTFRVFFFFLLLRCLIRFHRKRCIMFQNIPLTKPVFFLFPPLRI